MKKIKKNLSLKSLGLQKKTKEKNYKSGRLTFTTDLSEAIKKSNIIFICVGTPTKKNSNSADLKYVFNVANNLKKLISERSKIYSEANFKINCETLSKNMIVNQIIDFYEKN